MAALAVHDVVVEVVAEVLIEPHRLVVEGDALGRQIVGADDRRVARGVAAGEIALLDHGHVGDAPVARQVERRREAMAAAADDHHVVSFLQLRRTREVMLRRVLPAESVFQQAERHGAAKLRLDWTAPRHRTNWSKLVAAPCPVDSRQASARLPDRQENLLMCRKYRVLSDSDPLRADAARSAKIGCNWYCNADVPTAVGRMPEEIGL